MKTILMLVLAIGAAIDVKEPLVGEQSWPRQSQCVRRMKKAITRLDAKLPRLAGQWSIVESPDSVELRRERGGIKGTVYLQLAVDRAVGTHKRTGTGPWTSESGPFTLSKRRTGAEQGAWIFYTDVLTAKEGGAFEAIVEAALDDCVGTFDPIYRVERWTPNAGRMWFELQPVF